MKNFHNLKRKTTYVFLSFLILSISFDSFGQEKGYVFQSRGVPANPNAQTEYLQPDGSSVIIQMHGDAVVNWATTIDGYTLLMNNDNGFEYAVKSKNDDIILSGVLAQNPDKRGNDVLSLLAEIEPGISYSKAQVKAKKENHMFFRQKNKSVKSFPTTGTNNYVLILANFSNTATTYGQANFNNYMNQVNYNSTGSFRDYYLENSFNQLTVNTTVTIWVTLPQTHNYYGPQSKWGEFAYKSIQAADPYVNYANYDNDGDGVVDGIGIIHQGRGQEESSNINDIWSHSWDLTSAGYTSAQRTFDGTLTNEYTTQPELANAASAMTNIGVMCHEFGHNLGAPDFYDTDYATGGQYDGTGNWDLMAAGTWNNNGATPAHHNAFTKWFYYGWVTPVTISTGGYISMANIENNNILYLYTTNTSNEYFLLENRQQLGFDTYIPGHGLIIYHVDQNYIVAHFNANDINASSHQGMYPKAANGTINSTGCPFPGTSNKTSFTDSTTPNSKSWAGVNTNKPVTSIAENSQVITFTFMGGGPPVAQFTVDKLYPSNWMDWANFTDQSTNIPTSWLWTITPNTFNFVGGTGATSQNPTVSFTQPGAYTVSLQATNSVGSNSITKTDYIHVGQPGLWTGTTSTNWNTNTNWQNHEVPPSSVGVSITPAAINWPTKTGNLNIGTDCINLSMSGGYTQLTVTGDLTISNGNTLYVDPAGIPDINVDGNFTNHGTFTPGNSVVKMNGNTNSSLIANTSNNGSQTTLYAGSYTYPGGYFDIMASGGKNISVNSFDIHCTTTGIVNIEVWYTNGSYMGNTGTPGIWTQLGTTQTVTGSGWNNATNVNPGASLTIPSGASYGFYINCYSGSNGYLRFAAGSNSYSNADITVNTGDMAWAVPVGSGSWNGYTFNGTVYYSYPIQNSMPFWDLEINKTNASITTNGDLNINNNFMVKPGAWFTNAIGNSINVVGNTTFEANAYGTASFIDNGNSNFINSQPSIESYLAEEMWHLVSAPINNAQSIIFTGLYLLEFDEPTYTWISITQTNYNLTAGRGFMAWSSSGATGNVTINYNGPLNYGDINVTGLSYTSSQPVNDRGWNMVGNPYTSAINWNSNWARTNIDATVYIYNNGNYVTWNPTTGGTHPNGDIAPGQGFFVKANATGAALTIPQSERKHSSQAFYKNGPQMDELFLTVEGNGYSDKMIIQFNDEATTGFDNSFDAWKLKGNNAAPQIYSVYANNELTVNTLPFEGENMIVPINFEAGTNGQFTLSVTDLGNFGISSEIWLEDLRDNKMIDLTQVSSYGFNSNINDNTNRFLLHFGNPLGIGDENLSTPEIYSYGDMVYIQKPEGFDGQIEIYDMLGQEIISRKVTGEGLENVKVTSGTAYYLVKTQFGNKLITEKVFIK
jgi:M6 family metalloprotease-like protein